MFNHLIDGLLTLRNISGDGWLFVLFLAGDFDSLAKELLNNIQIKMQMIYMRNL